MPEIMYQRARILDSDKPSREFLEEKLGKDFELWVESQPPHFAKTYSIVDGGKFEGLSYWTNIKRKSDGVPNLVGADVIELQSGPDSIRPESSIPTYIIDCE